MTVAITEAIKTLAEAECRFGLSRTEDETFFLEWQTDLPALSAVERADLDGLRKRYLYQRAEGQLLEGTVTLLLASPLLAIAGFYDPPFTVRAEESIRLTLTDSEEVLQGRIDVLVLKNQLWVVVLESKKTALSAWAALPQTLAYLMANPQPELPSFGMVTNGDDILFVKLVQRFDDSTSESTSASSQCFYGLSRVFAPFTSSQELYSALQILKRIGQAFDGIPKAF
jgi:hypothetical protein